MYDIERIWFGVVDYLNLPLNAEISTDGIFKAIMNTTGFCRFKTLRRMVLNFEKREFVKRTTKEGIWVVNKLNEDKRDRWLEI